MTALPNVQMTAVSHLLLRPIQDGPHETPEWADEGVPFLSVDGIVGGRLEFSNARYISHAAHAEYSRKARPKRGDILLTKAASIGKVAEVETDIEFNVWSPLAILRPDPSLLVSRFLYFALQSRDSMDHLQTRSSENTQKNIAMSDLGTLKIPSCSLAEQRVIAEYLDRGTARIDSMILTRQRQRALLQEAIDSQLLELVDPSDDGNNAIPIRRILQKRSRSGQPSGVVTAFRNELVTLRDRRREDGFTESTTRSDYQGVKQGDVVFHGLDGFAGAIGVAEDDGICSPVYHVCSVLPGFDSRYVALALRALALSGFLALQSGNVRERAVDFRNWDSLARIRIPVPSLEQQRIRGSSYVDRRKTTDAVVDCLRRQVALFQERRQALISSAVAGQLDIPEAG